MYSMWNLTPADPSLCRIEMVGFQVLPFDSVLLVSFTLWNITILKYIFKYIKIFYMTLH